MYTCDHLQELNINVRHTVGGCQDPGGFIDHSSTKTFTFIHQQNLQTNNCIVKGVGSRNHRTRWQDWTVFTCQGHSPLGHSFPPTIRARGLSWLCVDKTMPHATDSEKKERNLIIPFCVRCTVSVSTCWRISCSDNLILRVPQSSGQRTAFTQYSLICYWLFGLTRQQFHQERGHPGQIRDPSRPRIFHVWSRTSEISIRAKSDWSIKTIALRFGFPQVYHNRGVQKVCFMFE